VLRPFLSVAFLVAAVGLYVQNALRSAALALVFALIGAASLYPHGGSTPARAEVPPTIATYRIYQKNLLRNGTARDALSDDIASSGSEFVTLQELSGFNRRSMKPLLAAYPSKIICGTIAGDANTVAVLSVYPMVAQSAGCGGINQFARMQVTLPDGTVVWLVSIHMKWPFPFGQAQQAENISAMLAQLDGPVLVGGDFNMVSWGSTIDQIATAARGRPVAGYATTYPRFGPLFPLPIDHVLLPTSASGVAQTRPLLGSDHLGVLVDFDF
jgi:endonuclease/exonuclease/phosphatase (EEP) superfamily protein YafD